MKDGVLPPFLEHCYSAMPVSVAQFLDTYSRGDKNLSDVSCPGCLTDTGLFAPPDSHKEHLRTAAVEKYLKLEHWSQRKIFTYIRAQVRKSIGAFGITVSLIHKKTTYVKYETKFEFKEVPRAVLIDGHVILSKGGLVILNTCRDWRTSQNPFVTGPPDIRFYAGASLMTSSGVPVGVLGIFGTMPKISFSLAKMKQLTKLAAQLMAFLDTPIEKVTFPDERALPENPNAGDVELAELSSRLGRATCNGGHMTIFERDGSGSCYSHSHIFRLSQHEELEQITDSTVAEAAKREMVQVLRKLKGLKGASKYITRSIASLYNFDCVVIAEVRFVERHRLSRATFPDPKVKNSNWVPQKLQKEMLAAMKMTADKCKVRILAASAMEHDLGNLDPRIWQEAFTSEAGIEITDAPGIPVYNSGIIVPFFASKPNFMKKGKSASAGEPVEVYLRSGGYVVGAFNRLASRSLVSPHLVSKVYDHVRIARLMYLNK